jgi:hypothetical protein
MLTGTKRIGLRASFPISISRVLQGGFIAICLACARFTWAAPEFRVGLAPNGTLSVDARDADVMEVLTRIAAMADIRLRVSGKAPKVTGTWSFTGVALESGIERVLGDIDHVILRRTDAQGQGEVESVWVLTTRGAPPPPLRQRQSTSDDKASPFPNNGEPAATPVDMEALLDSIAEIETSGDPDAVVRLESLLSSRDPLARSAVAAALARSGDERAQLALAQLLYGDSDAGVRHEAADALASSGQEHAVDLLRKALEDPDPGLRAHVESLLERLKANQHP